MPNFDYHIDILEDGIYLYDENGEEFVCWVQDEWVEDPTVVASIANAIKILCEKGPDELKKVLKRLG